MEVRRVLAPNPGPFTGPGTNTYVVTADGSSVVIDPGPVIGSHLEAVATAVAGSQPVAIVVTHTHPDHAPAANPLGLTLGVPVMGFAPGPSFRPDRLLEDGHVVAVGDGTLTVVHTPGHTADHVCLLGDDGRLFTGDHIMGGSTVIIEDAAAYLDSLVRLRALGARTLHPGHGEEMPDPDAVIDGYVEHRLERERQIVAAVDAGARSVDAIVEAVYGDVDVALRPAALVQVMVQLHKLRDEGRVHWPQGAVEYGALVEPAGEANS